MGQPGRGLERWATQGQVPSDQQPVLHKMFPVRADHS